MSFRRDLLGTRLASWQALQKRLAQIHLLPRRDQFSWNLLNNEKFLVESIYNALVHSDMPVLNNKHLLKIKVPLKTKIFTLYLRRGIVLTKDNLAKRNWQGSTKCVFCHHDENIKHLFFECQFARSIWSAIQVASNLYPPSSVANIFGNWLHGLDHTLRKDIRVGAIALLWSLWLCRNDSV